MSRGRHRSAFSHVAALLAVALLAIAGVRSTVMQAAEASPLAQTCLDMTGMAHGGNSPAGDHKAHKACDFCVVASVAPLQSLAPVLPQPGAVAWRPAVAAGSLGARGPPRLQPRARDPPLLLTA